MKITAKKAMMLVLAALLAAALFAGCSDGNGEAGGEEGEQSAGLKGEAGETYYMVVPESGNEYWYPVFETFKQAGSALGVKTVYEGAPEPDAQKQIEVVERVLKNNPKGILLSPASANELAETIDAAVEQGVAVVTLKTDAPNSSRQAFVGADHAEEGAEAARAISEELQGQGKVMVLRNLSDAACEARTNAFVDTIVREYPGIEIAFDDAANGDVDAARTLVVSAAQSDAGLSAVFCPDIPSAIGAADAVSEIESSIKCVCVDMDTAVLERITDGSIWMAVCADQGMQGYFGMLALFSAAHPDLVTPMNDRKRTGQSTVSLPFINSGINQVTKANAEHYAIADYAKALGYDTVEGLVAPGE